ncbi:MAG: type II toxin-antitoxin system HicA family toxin [Spirochaetales bacterium]|nr:type II toxin-antitoxin system HicA family toxin [Spirochaetales bacterium]
MKGYSSNEVIRILKRNGWNEVACVGDHQQFKHPKLPGRITVQHPKKDLPIGTVRNIFTYAGIKQEEK